MKFIQKLFSSKTSKQLHTLRKWNLVLAGLHGIQALAVLLLSNDRTFEITTNYITEGAASTPDDVVLTSATSTVFDLNLAYVVVAFFIMSSLAHLYIATVYRKRYEKGLKNGINRVRWFEYALSASTMMVGIGILSGIYDLSTLVAIFGLTAVMNLCGLVMELHNQKQEDVSWVSFVVGSIAGIIPWIVIGIYFWGANNYGTGDIPTFVYWIYASIFLFFNCFAINMYLQYKGVGKWKDYLYGERVYMILSLVAKSLLAWRVFAGALRP